MDNVKAVIKDTDGGRRVLIYMEPDGDDSIIHIITYVRGIGQADIKMSGPYDKMDAKWEKMEADDFEQGVEQAISSAKSLELGLTDAESTNS